MWETAPNEQNWKGDCICHYRTDNVCIGSCLMQPKRLRPMEQKCCMRRGANAAHSQALPSPASSQLWGLEAGTGSEEAAGPSWHLLYPGQVACGRLRGAKQQFQLLRAAHLPLLLPPFQLISSHLIHPPSTKSPPAHCSSHWHGPLLARPCIPRGPLGWVLPGTSSI